MRKINRVLSVAFVSAVPLLVAGTEPAAAWGWYGYRGCGCGYYAPRVYGYSYYRPRFVYGGFYRPRVYGWRGWSWRR